MLRVFRDDKAPFVCWKLTEQNITFFSTDTGGTTVKQQIYEASLDGFFIILGLKG